MKRDKKTNRSGAITLLLSVLLIAGISAVMVLYLRGLQEGDSGYTPVEPMQEAESTSDAEVPVDGTVDETLPEATGVQEQQANDTEVGAIFAENLAAAKEDRIALQEELEPGKVIREFTVDNQKFYLVKNGATNPEEATVSAEDAAAIALESWKEMFPENEWEGPFRIQLSYMQANFLYGEMPAQAMNLWFVDTIIPLKANNTNISMAIIHPESGEVLSVTCPREDNAACDVEEISPNDPYFSLQDFLFLSDDNTWIAQGNKLIREMSLSEVTDMIKFDEEKGISISVYGNVSADYYIGKGADARKIRLSMDLYTKKLTGCMYYNHF